MRKKSIVGNRNPLAALHRLLYGQGWTAAGAFAVVAVFAAPFAALPAAILTALCALIAALSLGSEWLEELIARIETTPCDPPHIEQEVEPQISEELRSQLQVEAAQLRGNGWSEADIEAVASSKTAVAFKRSKRAYR